MVVCLQLLAFFPAAEGFRFPAQDFVLVLECDIIGGQVKSLMPPYLLPV